MRNYGPGSELVRRHLQSFTAAAIASNWRSEAAPPGVSYPDVSKMSRDGARQVLTDLMNHIGLEIRQLNPPDTTPAALWERYRAGSGTPAWQVVCSYS